MNGVAVLSDRCPGLTERSRFKVPGGFSQTLPGGRGVPPSPRGPPKGAIFGPWDP